MIFSERLKQLPAVGALAGLRVWDAADQVVAVLEKRPGQAGSVAVYHALARLYGGCITPEAAALGLEWYGEHTAAARAQPGLHPNIDRLLAWSQGTASFRVELLPAQAPPA